jgi:hypothetical protein
VVGRKPFFIVDYFFRQYRSTDVFLLMHLFGVSGHPSQIFSARVRRKRRGGQSAQRGS